jgi:AcrR family transcriptional regulator
MSNTSTTLSRKRVSLASIKRPVESPEAQLSATARHMLDVAEQLFADKGVEHVSLREIVAASGQRNLSAARYHFGTREQLVSMLLARRLWFINEDRHARLDALEAAGQAGNVEALVRESLDALASNVRSQPWGANYVRVAAQATFSPLLNPYDIVDPVYLSGHLRITQMLRAALPDLPERTFRDRVRLVNNEIVFTLARWISDHGPVTPSNRRRYDALVRHTIEFLAAGMNAPTGEKK